MWYQISISRKGGKMIPSAKCRQENQHNFTLYYNDLCVLNGLTPLNTIKAHLNNQTLDFYGDRLKLEEWTPILKALRSDRHLQFIAIRSRSLATVLVHADTAVKAQQCRDRPVMYTRYIMKMLVSAVRDCLVGSSALKCLELEGWTLTKDDVKEIVKGVSRCASLENLSFHGSSLDEAAVEMICRCVKILPRIESLDLTGCGITEKGAHHVSGMLKHQKLTTYVEKWKHSLRDQQQEPLSQAAGLKRVTLNDNMLLGDRGAMEIIEEITDHIWLKALDMQRCGLTDVAAAVALAMLKTNTWLAIIDVRANDGISPVLVKLIMNQLHQNNAANPHQYLWISNSKYRAPGFERVQRRSARSRRRPSTAATSCGPNGAPTTPGYAQPRPGPRISARDATSGTRLIEQYQLQNPPYLHAAPPPACVEEKTANAEKDATIDVLSKRLDEVTEAMTSLSRCYEAEVERRKSAEAELHRIRSFLGEKGTGNIILNNETVQDIQDAFDAFARFLETIRTSGLAPRLEEAMEKEAAVTLELEAAAIQEREEVPKHNIKRKIYKSFRKYKQKQSEKLRRGASAPLLADKPTVLQTEATDQKAIKRSHQESHSHQEFADNRDQCDKTRNNGNSSIPATSITRAQAIFTQMTHGDGSHVSRLDKKCGRDGRRKDTNKRLLTHGDYSGISSQSSSWSILSELRCSSD